MLLASRVGSACSAQEAEGSSGDLTKTPDRISERPPQLAVFLLRRSCCVALVAIGTSRRSRHVRDLVVMGVTEGPPQGGLSLCAEHDRQLGGVSPLSSLMVAKDLRCIGCDWHIASIRTQASNGRYRRYSGHYSALALNGSVANDPHIDMTPGLRFTECIFDGQFNAHLNVATIVLMLIYSKSYLSGHAV